MYLEGAQTVPDAVENLRKGIALGGLDTFGAIARPMQDDSKPTVPFMMMKENKTQEETLRVVKIPYIIPGMKVVDFSETT